MSDDMFSGKGDKLIETTQLFYFIAASVALTLLPGPDILFVLTQSISQGKTAGMAIATGLCTGLLFHTTAAALGVSAILYSSAVAFSLLKYAGAIYLLYLAYKAISEEGSLTSLESVKEKNLSLLYRRGIFMNILNPKVSLFFLAFLPQFINANSGGIPLQMIFLGAVFFAQAIVVFFIVSFFAGMIGTKIMEKPGLGKKINWAKAGIYSVIGIELAFAHQ
jgi:threonine/homoserine/homoserine lactone efflux protein